jgi:phosphoheptose isomerase
MLIGITTSGHSPNIRAALVAARASLATACLTSRDGGEIAAEGLADHCSWCRTRARRGSRRCTSSSAT